MEHSLAQELAKLSLSVLSARRELDALALEKETYLQEREIEAQKRVEKTLELAQAALDEADGYAEAVISLQQQAEAVAAQITELKDRIHKDRTDYGNQVLKTNKLIERKSLNLEAKMVEMRNERSKVEAASKVFVVEQERLGVMKREIDGKRMMLKVTIDELKEKGLWPKHLETKIE